MSKIGGWHTCYNSDRAISNELGGKWELFFEETRDEAGAVGFEWDKDFDDTPLNLNGVLVIVNFPTLSGTATFSSFINGVETMRISNASTGASNTTSFMINKISNNAIFPYSVTRVALPNTITPSFGIPFMNIENINKFVFANIQGTNVPVGTNIKIYVLRGV